MRSAKCWFKSNRTSSKEKDTDVVDGACLSKFKECVCLVYLLEVCLKEATSDAASEHCD